MKKTWNFIKSIGSDIRGGHLFSEISSSDLLQSEGFQTSKRNKHRQQQQERVYEEQTKNINPTLNVKILSQYECINPTKDQTATMILQVAVEDSEVNKRKNCTAVFVIDVSGSMESEGRLEYVKRTIKSVSNKFEYKDSIGVVTFSTDAQVIFPIKMMDTNGRIDLENAVSKMYTQSTTNLEAGIMKGLELANNVNENDDIIIITFTDGETNVGEQDFDKLFDIISSKKPSNVSQLNFIGYHVSPEYDNKLGWLAKKLESKYRSITNTKQINDAITYCLGDLIKIGLKKPVITLDLLSPYISLLNDTTTNNYNGHDIEGTRKFVVEWETLYCGDCHVFFWNFSIDPAIGNNDSYHLLDVTISSENCDDLKFPLKMKSNIDAPSIPTNDLEYHDQLSTYFTNALLISLSKDETSYKSRIDSLIEQLNKNPAKNMIKTTQMIKRLKQTKNEIEHGTFVGDNAQNLLHIQKTNATVL